MKLDEIGLSSNEKSLLLECFENYIRVLSEKSSDSVCYNEDVRSIFSDRKKAVLALRDKILKV